MTDNLGRLQRVPLREVWLNESTHFTPWLARPENLQLLGETLKLELEVDSQEKGVGPFRADILCKESTSDTWVLIENQLERTDHSHLGQLLTYVPANSIINSGTRSGDRSEATVRLGLRAFCGAKLL